MQFFPAAMHLLHNLAPAVLHTHAQHTHLLSKLFILPDTPPTENSDEAAAARAAGVVVCPDPSLSRIELSQKKDEPDATLRPEGCGDSVLDDDDACRRNDLQGSISVSLLALHWDVKLVASVEASDRKLEFWKLDSLSLSLEELGLCEKRVFMRFRMLSAKLDRLFKLGGELPN